MVCHIVVDQVWRRKYGASVRREDSYLRASKDQALITICESIVPETIA